jgi:membrane protein
MQCRIDHPMAHGVKPSRFAVVPPWHHLFMKFWWKVLKTAVKDFMEDKALRLAAALAYYAMFSLAPLLIIVMAIASFLLDSATVQRQMHQQLSEMLGAQATAQIESMTAARQIGSSTMAMIGGVIVLIFGASGVFGQLQDALNTIWEVKAKPGGGILRFLRDRFLSMTMVLGLGFLLLISMVLTTAVEAMTAGMGRLFPLPDAVTLTLTLVASFVVVTVLFAMIFKVLPDLKIPWKIAFIGGAFTAILFTLGKWALGHYLGRESTASAYGTAWSVIVILLWIYYSSVILFMGAEFTQAYATVKGIKLRTSEYAVPATPEQRAQEGMGIKPGPPRPAAAFAQSKHTEPASTAAKGPLEVLQRDSAIHPWRSVFLAWGFGILTGWMFRRQLLTNAKG